MMCNLYCTESENFVASQTSQLKYICSLCMQRERFMHGSYARNYVRFSKKDAAPPPGCLIWEHKGSIPARLLESL